MKNKRPNQILEETIQLLRKIRQSKEISHDSLATRIGISRPAISHIESGKRKPTLLMVLKLAYGLETDLSVILREAEKKHAKITPQS